MLFSLAFVRTLSADLIFRGSMLQLFVRVGVALSFCGLCASSNTPTAQSRPCQGAFWLGGGLYREASVWADQLCRLFFYLVLRIL